MFCAITPCIVFFDVVFVSLSHFTRLAHPSQRKGALSVYHNIKKNQFKEYVDNAFFVCGCAPFLLLFCALTWSFPARNKDWMKSLSVVVMKPTALHIYNVSKCTSVSKFSMRVLQKDCLNLSQCGSLEWACTKSLRNSMLVETSGPCRS